MTETFSDATAQGSWSGAQGMWRKWQNLDNADKATMFPKPGMRDDLDNLFLAAKRSENVGTGSRTAPLASAVSSVLAPASTLAMGHPVLAAIETLGPALFSTLAHNPTFVRAAIQGLRAPMRSPAATMAVGKMMDIAGVNPEVKVAPQLPSALQPAGVAP